MKHPCFEPEARLRWGRVHLPVAPFCNISCAYCDRRHDCVNESRPGVASSLMTPAEAAAYLRETLAARPDIAVAGIAGPGDPLASPDLTLETLDRISDLGIIPCLSTNGLNLAAHVRELSRLGVNHVTLTINAVEPGIGGKIYLSVRHGDGTLSGRDGATWLLERQTLGLEAAKRHGMTVKINTVVIPGVNDAHVVDIARFAAGKGADYMNCLAVIPVAGTAVAELAPPDGDAMRLIRREAGRHIRQMRHCARCRADAAGLLHECGREAVLA